MPSVAARNTSTNIRERLSTDVITKRDEGRNASRNLDAVRHEVVKERGPDAGRGKMSDDISSGIGALFYETEDFVHLNDFSLHSGDFVDAGQLAPAIGKPLQLHYERHSGCNLTANACYRQPHARHCDHLLKALERIARRVGMDRGHRPFVTRVHRLQHVECFLATALADDDAIGPHTERILDQVALP